MDIQRKMKHQREAQPEWAHEIIKLPGCEKLFSCIQCGTCSGTCPLSIYMDYTPRRIINLVREGVRADALASQTIWLCASCYARTVECPREIRITDIMYELKQRAIQAGIYPKRFPIPVLAREFSEMVRKNGRITEMLLVMKLFLKTNPFAAMGNWRMGIDLFKTGRFSLATEKIKKRADIARMLDATDAKKGA